METHRPGQEGPVIGEVGLGCWQFGGDWGAMDNGTAEEIMSAFLASGVDFFDTANVYGAGRSEEWIGGRVAAARA
jgi:aryl-alcohol dehydrogenase-like predicted oxidoreductase